MTQKKKSKANKKKLTDVKCLPHCGNCGYFATDDASGYHGDKTCLNIDANREYNMDDLSEYKTCPYHDKDGYTCEDCGNRSDTDITIFVVEDKEHAHTHIFCHECLAEGIDDISDSHNLYTKMDLSITVISLDDLS